MSRIRFFLAAVICAAALSICRLDAQNLPSAEYIPSFHSDIIVNKDSTIVVTETIQVVANGNQIRHGIYRDFPTIYGSIFKRKQVGFYVLGVWRDGKPEQYSLKGQANGVRVYIGSESVIVNPGRHTYKIKYKTDHQLGYFADHDELYWNVTGNGWMFPISKATATVTLPRDVPAKSIKVEAYTGPRGGKGRNYAAKVDPRGMARFASTTKLGPGEGLTIVVSWEKGHVIAPTAVQDAVNLIKADMGVRYSLIGFLLLIIYCFLTWVIVGKDPPKGTIVPLYGPPDGLSPAAVRFIKRMGFDNKCITADIIDMAVRGYLRIEEDDGEYTLKRITEDTSSLTDDEKAIASTLFNKSDSITLSNAHHARIASAIRSARDTLKKSFQKRYFNTNTICLVPAVAITILILITEIYLQDDGKRYMAGFMTVWLSIWTLGVTALVSQVIKSWKLVSQGTTAAKTTGNSMSAGCLTLFAVPFVAGEIIGLFVISSATSPLFMIILLAVIIIDFIFYRAIKAPTAEGRKIIDAIDGFKEYLSVAESDNLSMFRGPEITPALFERFLPYALALDVEQKWSRKLNNALEASGQHPEDIPQPAWFAGASYAALGSGFASAFGDSLSGAISSSSVAPGSSSGSGGGGSSGGGGGGGGGGGW